jgi:hypothetical protein
LKSHISFVMSLTVHNVIVGKRTPRFRVRAAYFTPTTHAWCPAIASGEPCKHRLEERVRKEIDPAHVTPGGPTQCGCEAWAAAIQRYHPRGARAQNNCLTLTNCDPMKWATSPWEVAKAYLPSLGGFNATANCPEDVVLARTSADDFATSLFSLPQCCLAFQGATVALPDGSTHTFAVSIDKNRWAAVTAIRSNTLGLEQDAYDDDMASLEALLDDPALHTPGKPYVTPLPLVNSDTGVNISVPIQFS